MSFQLSLKSLKPKSAKSKRKLASATAGTVADTGTATKSPSSSRTNASNLTFDEADDGYREGPAAEQANLRKKRRIKITHVDSYDAQLDAAGADKAKPLTIKLDENETEFSAQLVTTQEEYDAVPVELFGDAILRGMGWDGKYDDDDSTDNKKLVVPHPEGLGIGAKGSNDITNIDSFMPIIEVKKERVSNEKKDKSDGGNNYRNSG